MLPCWAAAAGMRAPETEGEGLVRQRDRGCHCRAKLNS